MISPSRVTQKRRNVCEAQNFFEVFFRVYVLNLQQSNIPVRPPAASGTTDELASTVINIGSSWESVIFHSN
jgi:hypothetical protein